MGSTTELQERTGISSVGEMGPSPSAPSTPSSQLHQSLPPNPHHLPVQPLRTQGLKQSTQAASRASHSEGTSDGSTGISIFQVKKPRLRKPGKGWSHRLIPEFIFSTRPHSRKGKRAARDKSLENHAISHFFRTLCQWTQG